MPRRARPISEPDLFSIATVPHTPAPPATPPAPTAGSLDISPEDVGRVILRWSDDEVERLCGVVAAEARRRGLLPPERDPKGDASAGPSIRQRRPELLAKGLAPGKVNAIRAASRAGVKLSKIAQEFGVPLAAVKRVIAAATGS